MCAHERVPIAVLCVATQFLSSDQQPIITGYYLLYFQSLIHHGPHTSTQPKPEGKGKKLAGTILELNPTLCSKPHHYDDYTFKLVGATFAVSMESSLTTNSFFFVGGLSPQITIELCSDSY